MVKPKLIIFTGVDATGKSTIVKRISEEFNMPVIHMDKVSSEEEGKKLNYEILNNVNEDTIMDRYYMEEVVYAVVYRDYKAGYLEDLEQLLLSKFDVLIIYTFAKQSIIEERFKSRGESFTKIEDIKTLNKLYDDFLEKTLINKKILINTTNNLDENDYNNIIRMINDSFDKN